MLLAAKRGPHTNGLSPPNWRSTPVVRKLGDEVLHWVAVVTAHKALDPAALPARRRGRSSRHERECVYVTRLDRREVAAIKRCDGIDVASLGEHDDGSVDDAQREIRVLLGQLDDPPPIRVQDGLDQQLTPLEGAREGDLGVRSDAVTE